MDAIFAADGTLFIQLSSDNGRDLGKPARESGGDALLLSQARLSRILFQDLLQRSAEKVRV
jgi:hypothetical protein